MKNVWLEKSEARENVLVIVNERAYTQYVARPLNHQVIVELAQVSHRPDYTVVCHTQGNSAKHGFLTHAQSVYLESTDNFVFNVALTGNV